MKTSFAILSAFLMFGGGVRAESAKLEDQSPAQLKKDLGAKHPAAYYLIAAKLFKDPATKQEGLFWFYVGQIRYRYYLAANPDLPRDGDPALPASLPRSWAARSMNTPAPFLSRLRLETSILGWRRLNGWAVGVGVGSCTAICSFSRTTASLCLRSHPESASTTKNAAKNRDMARAEPVAAGASSPAQQV